MLFRSIPVRLLTQQERRAQAAATDFGQSEAALYHLQTASPNCRGK